MDLKDLENSYKVIDNFLDEDEFNKLQGIMYNSDMFPWFYNTGVANPLANEELNDFQFVHTFFKPGAEKSSLIPILGDLLKKIGPKTIYRLKANLTTITEEPKRTGWHVDFDDLVCITAVFYLNTNNGYTIFKNGLKVESVANRLVFFDSRMEHAGVTSTDSNARVLINLNYDLD
jgi:hypothetical protein